MRRWTAVALAAFAAAAVPAAGSSVGSGLYGHVRKGPVQPVCKVGVPCTAPLQTTLVFTRSGRAYEIRSGTQGAYRAMLAPGYYKVALLRRVGIGKAIRPARVHIRAGHVDRLDFFADTGIR